MPTTPEAIRTQVLAQLEEPATLLDQHGPDRDAAADFARGMIAMSCDLMTTLSRHQIALFLGLRAQATINLLITQFQAGEFDASPSLPIAYADAAAFVNAVGDALSQPTPIPS